MGPQGLPGPKGEPGEPGGGFMVSMLSKDHVSTHAQAVKNRNLQCSIRKSHKTLHRQTAGTSTAVSLSSCLAAATLCRANATR